MAVNEIAYLYGAVTCVAIYLQNDFIISETFYLRPNIEQTSNLYFS